MAKKEEPSQEPKLSNIPMPASENSLVIDLPDGQKLVVGNLDSGSVIEVATWRGTGRPDSRTSRLMLGMSTAQSASSAPENANVPSPEKRESERSNASKFSFSVPGIGFVKFKVPAVSLSGLKFPFVKSISSLFGNAKKSLIAKSKELAPVESVGDLDIENWLASIKKEATSKAELERPRSAPSRPVAGIKAVSKKATSKKAASKPTKK
jgi:hypothetical protein